MQERKETGQSEAYIEHIQDPGSNNSFVINLHALHNTHLIRRHLPRQLTAPIPLHSSPEARELEHNKLASQLRTQEEAAKKRAKRTRTEASERGKG